LDEFLTYWIPIIGKQTKCCVKAFGVLDVEDLILLDPSNNKMISYSAMRSTSLPDERLFQ